MQFWFLIYSIWFLVYSFGSSRPEVVLGKGVLKICNKFTGEQLCQIEISIKLLCNFIVITLWHGFSPVNLRHIFRPHFLRTPLYGCFCSFFYISKYINFHPSDWLECPVYFPNYIKKQPLEVFCKKVILNNFAIFTEKHLCWSLFLIKLRAPGNFI